MVSLPDSDESCLRRWLLGAAHALATEAPPDPSSVCEVIPPAAHVAEPFADALAVLLCAGPCDAEIGIPVGIRDAAEQRMRFLEIRRLADIRRLWVVEKHTLENASEMPAHRHVFVTRWSETGALAAGVRYRAVGWVAQSLQAEVGAGGSQV